jgi:hypothetical protein
MKCKDCKFWQRNKETEYNKPDIRFGSCSNPHFVYGKKSYYGTTTHKLNRSTITISDDSLAYDDHEEWSASFDTGQNFGCIHFEKN